MDNTERDREMFREFGETLKDLKKDIGDIALKVGRVETILEGAGNGGILADMKRIELKVDKLEAEFRIEVEKLKKKAWQFSGGIAIISIFAGYVLPKFFA